MARRYRRKRRTRSRAWSPENEGGHKAFTVEEWQAEVLADRTRMGYWPWVREMLKENDLKDRHEDLFAGAEA